MKEVQYSAWSVRRCVHWLASVLALVLLAACAAPGPHDPQALESSRVMFRKQLDDARVQLAPGQPPRLVLVAMALHDQSKAFAGDVDAARELAQKIDPAAVVLQFINPSFGQSLDRPFATRQAAQQVMQELPKILRPQDRLMVLLTSHGQVDQLAVHAGNRSLSMIRKADLSAWLAPLKGRPLWLIISACHSGSFMDAVQNPLWVVSTASAADRVSFGCNFTSTSTYFGDALLRQSGLPQHSLEAGMREAAAVVGAREARMNFEASQPQAFVGARADWARRPLADWLKP